MFLLLLLMACDGTVAPVEPACPHGVDGWFGDASRHLAQGGTFHDTPDEPWIASIQGVQAGHGSSFAVTTRYVDGYFLVQQDLIGGGQRWADGDYDLSWGSAVRDVLGVVEQATVSESRRGCRMSRRVEANGAIVSTEAQTLDDHTVTGVLTNSASDFDVTATWRSDHSAELAYAGYDGESWYDVDEPGDGTRDATFHLAYDGGTEDGGYQRGLDGAREYGFDRFPDSGEWQVMHIWWLLNYDSSGQGEVVGEGSDGSSLTCWYAWDAAGVGSYSCDDGTSGPY